MLSLFRRKEAPAQCTLPLDKQAQPHTAGDFNEGTS